MKEGIDALTEEETAKLVEKAKEGMKNAYIPYVDFQTGAAVLTTKGNYYQGCNVQSSISGAGACAEITAIYHAIVNGEYTFKAIAVVTSEEEPVKPCGVCLQYINEFAQIGNNDIVIIMVGSNGEIKKSSISKELPGGWGPRNLGVDISKYEG